MKNQEDMLYFLPERNFFIISITGRCDFLNEQILVFPGFDLIDKCVLN